MKDRIISALVLALVCIPILIYGRWIFKVFVTILAIRGLYEMIKIKYEDKQPPIIMRLLSYLIVIFLCINNANLHINEYTINYQFIAIILFIYLIALIIYDNNKKYNVEDALYLASSSLFIGFSFNLIILIRNYDINYLIYILLIAIFTDTYALISGYLVGKHKLCPHISPKKTIEGAVGGTLMGTFVGTFFYVTVINSNISLIFIILITMILSLVGQAGDLIFSCMKRQYNKKDFSNLIPGHGGLLDRVDSLIFVSLAFMMLMIYI